MSPHDVRIRERVLRGIAANRTAGFHFPGHFVDVRWPTVSMQRAVLTLADGAHVRDAAGAVHRTVLMVLADSAVATAARLTLPAGARLATVHLHLHFTGVAARGDVVAEATPHGSGAGTDAASWLGAATLTVGGKPVCYATGEFMHLSPPPGVTLAPLPWQRDSVMSALPDEATLGASERAVTEAATHALARITPTMPFIECFWGGERDGAGSAERRLAIGPHLSNRVGHVQGGISLGFATAAACDAAPASMSLSNVSAWYVRPAQGDTLRARSHVIHSGRTTAVVRTQVLGSDDEVALEVCTQHVGRAAAT